MPRTCTICGHASRAAIDQALVSGESAPKIAAKYRVSDDAVTRHRAHIPAQLLKAQEATDVRQALDVVMQLRAINSATIAILKSARASEDHKLALLAVDRVQKQIELQARLLGELDDRPVVNVLITPEWQRLRAVIVEALADEPSARIKVAAALRRVDAGE
jgi:hypothetical protein